MRPLPGCAAIITTFAAGCIAAACGGPMQDVNRTPMKGVDLNTLPREQLQEAMRTHPFRMYQSWGRDFAFKPLDKRVLAADEMFFDYMRLQNKLDGFDDVPGPAKNAKGFAKDVRKALQNLPGPVRKLAAKHLVAVLLVDNLGGSAYTEYLDNGIEEPIGGILAIDAGRLDKKANEWATWREKSPFAPAENFDLVATIEDPKNDNRVQAIQYILLHELGHIIGTFEKIHPRWGEEKIMDIAGYPFCEVSWEMVPDAPVRRKDPDATPLLGLATYYSFGKSKLSFTQHLETYKQLQTTALPTLYAATNIFEDFAESFASYVHIKLLGRPWQIQLYQNGYVVHVYNSPWDSPRMRAKREILEKLIRRAQ